MLEIKTSKSQKNTLLRNIKQKNVRRRFKIKNSKLNYINLPTKSCCLVVEPLGSNLGTKVPTAFVTTVRTTDWPLY